MESIIFAKAWKLKSTVKLEGELPFTCFYKVGDYEVHMDNRGGGVKVLCTCELMSRRHPDLICSHKLAVMLHRSEVEGNGKRETIAEANAST